MNGTDNRIEYVADGNPYKLCISNSVSPIRETGEWVDVSLPVEHHVRDCRCSICGKWNIGDILELPTFCGHCGHKMSSDTYRLYDSE